MLPDQQNLICPVRISCSASFTASAGFQVGSAPTQHPATRASTRTRKIFIQRGNEISYRQRKRGFSTALSVHSYYHFPASVSLFEIADRLWDFTQLVSPIDDWFHFSGLHHIGQHGQVLLARVRHHHAHFLTHER